MSIESFPTIKNENAYRYQTVFPKVCVVLFSVSAMLVMLFPWATVLKYSILPLSIFAMYRYDEFDYIIFPLAFMDDAIGTFVAGRLTLLNFYLIVLAFKYLSSGKLRLEKSKGLFVTISCLYFLLEFVVLGLSAKALKCIFVILCSVLVSQDHLENSHRLHSLSFVLCCSALVPATTMAFCLNGMLWDGRAIGLGATDPNYASLICVIGLALVLNNDTLSENRWIYSLIRFLCCCLYIIGIFRSASRAGLIVALLVVLLKIFLQNRGTKKLKFIIGLMFVAILGYILFMKGVIRIGNLNEIVSRWQQTLTSYQAGDIRDVTNGRNGIFETYMTYFLEQNPLKMLFGGNFPGTEYFLSKSEIPYVTHNVYLDFLLGFGIVGTVYLLVISLKRTIQYLNCYRKSGESIFLGMTIMKLSVYVMGATLALLQTYYGWLVFIY